MKLIRYTNSGRIHLGDKIGEGGEGAVYTVEGEPTVVAKIYRQVIDQRKQEKLLLMLQAGDEKLTRVSSWPTDVLFSKDNRIVGIMMPRISSDFVPIHHLFNPQHRKSSFPQSDWRLLLYTAKNLSVVVHILHSHGHVIGDLNESNVLVNKKAGVRLIDCDSFQISHGGETFLCTVGVPQYTPPELQGRSFSSVRRSENHDCFGLAVMIFQLLMMGRHPFLGRSTIRDEFLRIPDAIKQCHYPYARSSNRSRLRPPTKAPQISILSRRVQGMLETAFDKSSTVAGRPRAELWHEALSQMEPQLHRCQEDALHWHFKILTECPWCTLEDRGVVLFISSKRPTQPADRFDYAVILKRIEAVTSPGPLPTLPSVDPQTLRPSQPPIPYTRAKSRRWTYASAIIAVAILLAVFYREHTAGILVAGLGLAGIPWIRAPKAIREERRARRQKQRLARQRYQKVIEMWEKEASDVEFKKTQRTLQKTAQDYLELSRSLEKELKELSNAARALQLNHFLQKHFIEKALIRGVGPGLTSTLLSYGIVTAADVDYYSIIRIPGFGRKRSQSLLAWRKSVEKSFRFNPRKAVPRAEETRVRSKYERKRIEMERVLSRGPATLKRERDKALRKRTQLRPRVIRKAVELAQAKKELKAL